MEDKQGNSETDAAADFGRRHQPEDFMDEWRTLLRARELWYPNVLQLHRFMVAIARVSVNHDGRGGSAPDPLVWDEGSRRKQRKVDVGVKCRPCYASWPSRFLAWALGSGAAY